LSLSDSEARALFAAFDTDGSGSVDLREMLTKFKMLDRMSSSKAPAGVDSGHAIDNAQPLSNMPFFALKAGKEPWNNSTFLGDWGIVGNGQPDRPRYGAGTANAGGHSVPPVMLATQQQERAETPWSRNSRRHNARLAANSRRGCRRKDGKPVYRTPSQRQSDASVAMRIEKRRRAELRIKQADPNFDEHAARWPGNATHAPFAAVLESNPLAGWFDKLKAAARVTQNVTAGHLTARGVGETVSGKVRGPPAPPRRAASAGRTRRPRSGRRSTPGVVYKGLTPPLY